MKAPMLAESGPEEAGWEELIPKLPLLMSFKIDGVRATVQELDGEVRLISRSGIPIINQVLQETFAKPGLFGCDGELALGDPSDPDVFHKTSGICRRLNDRAADGINYHVFDSINEMPFVLRHEEYMFRCSRFCRENPTLSNRVCSLTQSLVSKAEELEHFVSLALDLNYEGVVGRKPDSPYKEGRSTWNESYLLRYKPHIDTEGIVVGFEARNENKNAPEKDAFGYQTRSSAKAGMIALEEMGALTIRCPRFTNEFNISGFTMELRKELWAERDTLPGKIVTFRYWPHGSTPEAPRHPQFKGFRMLEDLETTTVQTLNALVAR